MYQNAAPNGRVNAVLYARVSSKEQEREGFSIPAQLELLHNYSRQHGITVLQEFVESESAWEGGRTEFGEMLTFLNKNRAKCRTVLVEKTDRLYRNLKDFVTLDELKVDLHFVKENVVISPDSRSSDQFIHGMKVLMARNYSLNLGEETLKGMVQKAKAGLYPSCAPAGYRNIEGPDQKRIVVPNGDAPTITRLFEEFATGRYSLKALAAKSRVGGWTVGGRRLHKSTLHQILRKRIYTGDFDWNGVTYRGAHEPLVNRETWERVQSLFDERIRTRQHRIKHDFAYTGIVRCGHCGCALVAELKKGKYVYYHCTGHRGKCPEPYTREEAMEGQLAASLRELVIPPAVLTWLQEAVAESDLNERAARERELKRMDEQRRRLESKLDAMYEDRLEGRISPEMYDRKAKELRAQCVELSRRVDEIQASAPAPVQEAVNLMSLTSRTADMFLAQPAHEKQGFLRLVLKSACWQDGRLQTEFEEPFESLRCSNHVSLRKHEGNCMHSAEVGNWLPGMDSNHN